MYSITFLQNRPYFFPSDFFPPGVLFCTCYISAYLHIDNVEREMKELKTVHAPISGLILEILLVKLERRWHEMQGRVKTRHHKEAESGRSSYPCCDLHLTEVVFLIVTIIWRRGIQLFCNPMIQQIISDNSP